MLTYAKKENTKNSVKVYLNKGYSEALCSLSEKQKTDSLKVKCEDALKKSEYFKRNQNFSGLIRQDLAPNNNMTSSNTVVLKHQQKAHINSKNPKSDGNFTDKTKLPENESNCCSSEVNIESCDKKQTSYQDNFENYSRTSSYSENFSNDTTFISNKINGLDTWESLHSILSSRSEMHLAPSFKKHTKNKNCFRNKPEKLIENLRGLSEKCNSKPVESCKSKSEDLRNYSKKTNIKDSDKTSLDKCDRSQAKCFSNKKKKIVEIKDKPKKELKISEDLNNKESFSLHGKHYSTSNTDLMCFEKKNYSKYKNILQTKHKILKSEVKYTIATKLPEFDCCGSEVNTKSGDKKQSCYLNKFRNYASTSLTSTNFLNDEDNFLTNTHNKTNDFDTWESLHSILSCSSKTHLVKNYKKVTKNKRNSLKYFKFFRCNKISPTSEKPKEENKPKVKKLVSNASKRMRKSLENLKRSFVKSFSCFSNFD